jgi:hypothetical protein
MIYNPCELQIFAGLSKDILKDNLGKVYHDCYEQKYKAVIRAFGDEKRTE